MLFLESVKSTPSITQTTNQMKKIFTISFLLLTANMLLASGRFDGYTDPKANEKKLLRNVFKHGDCWFNSGDLVRRQGWQHIQFVDRLGDTFRWKGENVATSEVEGVLAKLPFLEHAVVYGVKLEGFDGRAGMAAVSVKPGCTLDLVEMARHLLANLPAHPRAGR